MSPQVRCLFPQTRLRDMTLCFRLLVLLAFCFGPTLTSVNADAAEPKLLQVVRERFTDLTDDEARVVRRIAESQVAPAEGEPVAMRADVIGFLCKTREALDHVPTRGLYFENVVIRGEFDLSFAKLSLPLTFQQCRFIDQKSKLSFRQGNFLSITMALCSDVPGINARGVRVEHSFIFESQTRSEIDLKNADIGNDLDFETATLSHDEKNPRASLYARNARIGGDLILDETTSRGSIDLQGATIGGMLSAHNAKIETSSPVDAIAMLPALDLVGTTIGRDVELEDSRMAGPLQLADTDVTKTVRLRNLEHGTNYTLDLSGLSCNRLVMDASARPTIGKLRLHGCVYEDISISVASESETETCLAWVRLLGSDHFSEQPYEQLAGVMKRQGKDDIARAILIAKVEDEPLRTYTDLLIRRLAWMIGYGYSPLRAVWLALAVVLVGFVVFKGAYRRGYLIVKTNNAPVMLKSPNLTLLMYSVDVFVPLVDFGVGPLYVPGKVDIGMDSHEVTFFRLYYWFHVGAGWLICTVAVAGLSGLIRV